MPYSLTYTANPGARSSLEQGPAPHLSCARWGRVIVTATNSHGEMALGGIHGRESLRLNLHCLGPLTVERKWAPPAGYGHLN